MKLQKLIESNKYVECVPVIKNAKLKIVCDYCLISTDVMDNHLKESNHYEGTVKLLTLFKEVASKITDDSLKETSFVVNFSSKGEWTCVVRAEIIDEKMVLIFEEMVK